MKVAPAVDAHAQKMLIVVVMVVIATTVGMGAWFLFWQRKTGDIAPVEERASDLNGDEIVNILDMTIVALAFGTELGDPNWNPTTDLNNDGIINITDLEIIREDFWKTW